MLHVSFFWAPEGRKIDTIAAESVAKAKEVFRHKYRDSYAKYMGEVYVKSAPYAK